MDAYQLEQIYQLEQRKEVEFETREEILEAYSQGKINNHKRDVELLKLSKKAINETRESYFGHGNYDLNRAI